MARQAGGTQAGKKKAGRRTTASGGVAGRLQKLMQDDLGGGVPFRALTYVKASLREEMAQRATFRDIRQAVHSGEMALALAGRSVASHPIEAVMQNSGRTAACAGGCAFCCILTADGNGGPITRAEATRLFDALVALRGTPDGRAWHREACAALDPETRMCRAYESRPVLCRATASSDPEICAALSEGDESRGTAARHSASYMLHVAQALGRRSFGAEAPTYALARFAAAVLDGAELEEALKAARHSAAETAEITRDAVAAFAYATQGA